MLDLRKTEFVKTIVLNPVPDTIMLCPNNPARVYLQIRATAGFAWRLSPAPQPGEEGSFFIEATDFFELSFAVNGPMTCAEWYAKDCNNTAFLVMELVAKGGIDSCFNLQSRPPNIIRIDGEHYRIQRNAK